MQGVVTLNPFSPQAAAISHLFVAILLVLAGIFALVAALVIYASIRYRDRPGAPEARQEFGSRRLEIAWTLGPVLLLAVIFAFMVRAINASDPPIEDRQPDLRVIGHQWWWEVEYPKSGVVTANEIHIPIGTSMLVEVDAADVIHDFWVPELARKVDAIPGHVNHLWIRADTAGVYWGACAEFCGSEHAWMRMIVVAQPQADFDAWQSVQLTTPPIPVAGAQGQGAQLVKDETCLNCHAISGLPGNKRIGPDLTHIAGRRIIAAGATENTPENLYRWLKDPASIKPESHMPNFLLSDDNAHALVAYLETLN
ncbi:MAG TPA: cytochrome c oxidase subunit II [Candidatus Binataceae bacterium]|nr:cytochrome c oxidase subunit II [Candidatus Binataceae bacterium]